jgi:uncharacterized cysteine cluster protein YcgN (CxxCxxCC family)
MNYVEAMKLAREALNTTESDCGSRAWEREQEAITCLDAAILEANLGHCREVNDRRKVQAFVTITPPATPVQEPRGYQWFDTAVFRKKLPENAELSAWHPLYTTIPAAQPAVPHPVIAGALFDFMGWLTSRDQRLTLSSTDEAGPAVEAITEFAKMRGLSLDEARVQNWQDNTTPTEAAQPAVQEFNCPRCGHVCAQRQWVGLTNKEKRNIVMTSDTPSCVLMNAEAKLKEKNT